LAIHNSIVLLFFLSLRDSLQSVLGCSKPPSNSFFSHYPLIPHSILRHRFPLFLILFHPPPLRVDSAVSPLLVLSRWWRIPVPASTASSGRLLTLTFSLPDRCLCFFPRFSQPPRFAHFPASLMVVVCNTTPRPHHGSIWYLVFSLFSSDFNRTHFEVLLPRTGLTHVKDPHAFLLSPPMSFSLPVTHKDTFDPAIFPPFLRKCFCVVTLIFAPIPRCSVKLTRFFPSPPFSEGALVSFPSFFFRWKGRLSAPLLPAPLFLLFAAQAFLVIPSYSSVACVLFLGVNLCFPPFG